MKKLLATLLPMALFLSGCGSTSDTSQSAGASSNERGINIASTEEYQWDNESSLALNLAKLSLPAGVGYGLRDTDKPKELSLGRSGSSLLSGFSGFLTGGFGAAAGNLLMDSESDAKRSWNISFVQTFSEDELTITNLHESKRVVSQRLGEAIFSSIKVLHPDTILEGVFEHKSKKVNRYTSIVVLSGRVCEDAYTFGYDFSKDDAPDVADSSRIINFSVGEGVKNPEISCSLFFEPAVVGKVNGKFAVVSEVSKNNGSVYLAHEASKSFADGAVLFPDRSIYTVSGVKRFGIPQKFFWSYPYPVVMHNGQEYLFDKEETSKSTSIQL